MRNSTGTKIVRAKTGCATCRIRRIKCDEAKPECQKCSSTGRTCDGYSTLPFSRHDLQIASQASSAQTSSPACPSDFRPGLLPTLTSDPAFSDVLEKRYFQFFRQQTVVSSNNLVDCRFWDRVVLQQAHAEPAVKHAVLALASLHHLAHVHNDSSAAQEHQAYAERQHQKALFEARTLVSSAAPQDVDRVLVACIIFTIYESVRGNYKASQTHMDSGRAIIAQHRHRLQSASRRHDLNEIVEAFARLDVSAISFSDTKAMYHYTLTDFYGTNPDLHPGPFRDFREARVSLVDLVRWLLVIAWSIEVEKVSSDCSRFRQLKVELDRCSARIQTWYKHFEDFIRLKGSGSTPLATMLKLWHTTAVCMLEAGFLGPETRWDAAKPHFERMVSLSEQLSACTLQTEDTNGNFSLDLGFTIPAFMVASHCRDPLLRRRAIQVLSLHPRQEGMWESTAAATIANRWMEIEEFGLGDVRTADDVPECRRIRYVDLTVDIDGHSADLSWTVLSGEIGDEIVWDDQVRWEHRPVIVNPAC